MRSLSIAATGMLAQQLNVEVISNNLANMNTTGYKRQRAEFQDLLYQDMRQVGATSSDTGTIVPSGVQLGAGVHSGSVYRITEQGSMISTENRLDVAIEGRGYFQIRRPDGTTAYSRAGAFQLSPTGEIVNADGYTILPAITVPNATEISINENGQVQAKLPGQTSPTNVGQFELALFANEGGLRALGDNLFEETPASGSPTTGTPGASGFGTLLQGFLESANVNAVAEITNLIAAQRAYELNSKVIETADQMLGSVTNMR
ncbi:MAG: flagellar basal-body rod protein FlgG [Alphaproteobacteria bacterium]